MRLPTRQIALTALIVVPMTLAAQQRPAGAPPNLNTAARQDTGRSPGDSAGGRRVATSPAQDIIAMAQMPPVVTRRSVNARGQSINYTAHAGMLPIKNGETNAIEGGMYYVSYTKDGANAATRPITFVFNGGPGSSTVWLHLGAFGPRKVRLLADGSAPPPPYSFEDNPYTLLDQTDLVFLDPIGTGYSRAASQQLGTRFWGLDEDLRSVQEFIRLYLTRYDRMASPKFLAGESYGTTRAAGLSGTLADAGIALNGVALISTVLNFGYSSQSRGNDLGFINFIPTYTATAWYHKKLPAELQRLSLVDVTAQAERWAASDYATALMKGNRLTPAEFRAAAEQMARFTGLKSDVIEQNELRVPLQVFNTELLQDQRKTVGRLDSRFTGFATLVAGGGRFGGGPQVGDPSEVVIRNTFTPVLTDYNRRELNYKNEDAYYILGGGIGPWNYPQNQYATVVPNLERAFAKNPYMKLFVAEGYFDGATPYFAADYTLSHMSVDPTVVKTNIMVERYPAGHMMYIDEGSMKKLRSDLARFYDGATKSQVVP
jgi:carboxypeptidase C (cathepsin A)